MFPASLNMTETTNSKESPFLLLELHLRVHVL